MNKESLEQLKDLIKDLKSEMRDNNLCIKDAVKCRDYAEAAHLESVNGALDYVLIRLRSITSK